jgi:hypothetical protein
MWGISWLDENRLAFQGLYSMEEVSFIYRFCAFYLSRVGLAVRVIFFAVWWLKP